MRCCLLQYTSRAAQLYRQQLERDVKKGIAAAQEVREVEASAAAGNAQQLTAQAVASTPSIGSEVSSIPLRCR